MIQNEQNEMDNPLPVEISNFLDAYEKEAMDALKSLTLQVQKTEVKGEINLLEDMLCLSGWKEGLEVLFARLSELLEQEWGEKLRKKMHEDRECFVGKRDPIKTTKLKKLILYDQVWEKNNAKEFARMILFELFRKESAFTSIIHAWSFWMAYIEARKDEPHGLIHEIRNLQIDHNMNRSIRMAYLIRMLGGKMMKLFLIAVKEFKREEEDYGSFDISGGRNFDYYANRYADSLKLEKINTGYNRGRSPRLDALAKYDLEHIRRRLEGLDDDAIVDVETFGIISFDPEGNLIQVPMNCYRAVNNQF